MNNILRIKKIVITGNGIYKLRVVESRSLFSLFTLKDQIIPFRNHDSALVVSLDVLLFDLMVCFPVCSVL